MGQTIEQIILSHYLDLADIAKENKTMEIIMGKIDAVKANHVGNRVMQKIAEAFNRYLKSGNSYAKDNWTVDQIVKYEEDKDFCKTIYNENRLKMNFDDAHDLARTKLFEKIIKETFPVDKPVKPANGDIIKIIDDMLVNDRKVFNEIDTVYKNKKLKEHRRLYWGGKIQALNELKSRLAGNLPSDKRKE